MPNWKTAPVLAGLLAEKYNLSAEQKRQLAELPVDGLEVIAEDLARLTGAAADEAKPACPKTVFDEIRNEKAAEQEEEQQRKERFRERMGS